MIVSTYSRIGRCAVGKALFLVPALVLMLLMNTPAPAQQDYIVHVDIVRAGQTEAVDILYANKDYEIRIWAQNLYVIGGFNFPFEISSPDGMTWTWRAVPGGYGEGGIGNGHACVTRAPGSCFYPESFDMTGLLVEEFDLDGQLADSIMMWAVTLMQGFPPCTLQPWMLLHFTTGPVAYGDTLVLCIDSIYEGSSSNVNLTMADVFGIPIFPEFGGPYCWPVTYCCQIPGDVNDDWNFGMGDAVYVIAYIFKHGPPLGCEDEGDVNADGTVNVGDVVYMINYIFRGGPPLQCP